MIRRYCRLFLTIPAVLAGAIVIRLCVAVDRSRGRQPLSGIARRVQKHWCRGFCRLYGIRIVSDGEPLAPAPTLIPANHVSWLDIVVVSAQWPVAFVSKSEVAGWPVIGGVATGLGTVYIQRGARDAAAGTGALMARRLQDGDRVLFFPEGTTSDGSRLRPFRPRLYQAAIDGAAAVQPLALSYRTPDGDLCETVAFVGDESLLANLWRLARVPRLVVRLELDRAVPAGARTRTELSAMSRAVLLARLGLSEESGSVVSEP